MISALVCFSVILTALASYFALVEPENIDIHSSITEGDNKPGLIKCSSALLEKAKKKFRTLTLPEILLIIGFSLISGAAAYRLFILEIGILPCAKILFAFITCSCAAIIDAKERRIPNMLILILLGMRLMLIPLDFIIYGGSDGWRLLLMSAIGGGAALAVLFLFSVLSKGGFGMGDVKLCGAIGFAAGLSAVMYSVVFGMVLCAMFAVILLVIKKKTLKDQLAFAPFIYLGMAVCIALGRV